MQPYLNSLSPVLLIVLSLVLVPALQAQQGPNSKRDLKRQIEHLIETDAYANAFWGVQVLNAESGEVLYSRNARKSFVPASNMKLYTTAVALDQLGPDFRFETGVYVDGPVTDGVLTGNLIIRGSGDPTIGGRFHDGDRTETFRAWADSLRASGIRHITGDVIGDDDVFDDLPLGYGWSWDDEPFYYSAEIGGLVFNDNSVDFEIESTREGTPAEITWEPDNTDYIRVTNATLTLPADSSLDEGYFRPRGTNDFRIYSQVPEGRIDDESLTVHNPTLYFTHVLREVLVRAGIVIEGTARDVDDLSIKPAYTEPRNRLLFRHTSPSMREIVEVINKESQNLYAEQVLRVLGARTDTTAPGSAETGVEAALVTFARAKIDTSRIEMVDGSGLSRLNLITPEMTTQLLHYIWTHPDTAITRAYIASLPIAGVDGTLESRFEEGGPARENARAKTGFVSYVRTLSGYVTSTGGTPLIFSVMANHYTIKTREVNRTQDALVNVLAAFRR